MERANDSVVLPESGGGGERLFRGRTALVTGAGTGIGAATAELLAARGATVSLVGRREKQLDDVVARIVGAGGCALSIVADVSRPAEIEAAIARTVATFGAMHLAVNGAGTSGRDAEVSDVTIAEWDATIATNLSAVFYGMKFQIPAMLAAGGGAIVNVSSVYADRGLFRHAAYSASKHGIRGLTRSAAVDYAARGIRINEVQPGVIATPASTRDPEAIRRIAALVPSGRAGRVTETAEAICFLLSNAASYITGTHFSVDGGFLA